MALLICSCKRHGNRCFVAWCALRGKVTDVRGVTAIRCQGRCQGGGMGKLTHCDECSRALELWSLRFAGSSSQSNSLRSEETATQGNSDPAQAFTGCPIFNLVFSKSFLMVTLERREGQKPRDVLDCIFRVADGWAPSAILRLADTLRLGDVAVHVGGWFEDLPELPGQRRCLHCTSVTTRESSGKAAVSFRAQTGLKKIGAKPASVDSSSRGRAPGKHTATRIGSKPSPQRGSFLFRSVQKRSEDAHVGCKTFRSATKQA